MDLETYFKTLLYYTLTEKRLLRKSYSHKPHLQSLPYDLNTNDPDKLKKRLDAIDEEIKTVTNVLEGDRKHLKDMEKAYEKNEKEIKERSLENKELADKLSDLDKLEAEVDDFMTRMQGEALDESTYIRDAWDDLKKTAPDSPIQPTLDDKTDILMNTFGVDEFEFQGMLYSGDAEAMRNLAVMVEEYGLSSSNGDEYSSWAMECMGLADMITDLADKHDVTKNNDWKDYVNRLGDNFNDRKKWEKTKVDNEKVINLLKDTQRNYETPLKNTRRDIRRSETMLNDYNRERERTKDKYDKVKGAN